MAIGISVTGSAVLGFTITVTQANEGAKLQVRRADNTGYYDTVAVRGADFISPSAATMVFTDNEAPFNSNLTYTASSYSLSDLVTPIHSASQVKSGSATSVPNGFSMIHQVFDSAERVAGTLVQLPTQTRDAKVLSKSEVLLRSNPVIITDVLGGRKGDLKMSNVISVTTDYDGLAAIEQFATYLGKWRSVFADGSTLMFRNDALRSGFDDMYFKCQGVTIEGSGQPVGANYPDYPILIYTINYSEVDRPLTTTSGLGLTTWNDVYASNANWTEVNSTHLNWLSVLNNPLL